jgi:hypothetical protein
MAGAARSRDGTKPRECDDNHRMEDWIVYQNGDPAAWRDAGTNQPPTNIVHALLQACIADKIELRARRTQRKFRGLVSALRENRLDDVHSQHQWTLDTKYPHSMCYGGDGSLGSCPGPVCTRLNRSPLEKSVSESICICGTCRAPSQSA